MAKYIEQSLSKINDTFVFKNIVQTNYKSYKASPYQEQIYTHSIYTHSSDPTAYNTILFLHPTHLPLSGNGIFVNPIEDYDIDKLTISCNQLIRLHTSLTTVFSWDIYTHSLHQHIHLPEDKPIHLIHLDNERLSSDELEIYVKNKIRYLLNSVSFSLSESNNLYEFYAIIYPCKTKIILFMLLHHILIDGMSSPLLQNDFIKIYSLEKTIPTLQYIDFNINLLFNGRY